MKKLINTITIIALCLTANILVFSQKNRNIRIKDESVVAQKSVPKAEIKLAEAAAFSDGNGVYLRWSTEAESNILGFYVYRVNAKDSVLASSSIIPGGYMHSRLAANYNGAYSFFDPQGNLGNSYYIEALGLDGKRQNLGQVMPVYVNDLKTIAGQTSNELRISAENAGNSVTQTELNYPATYQKQFEENVLPPDLNTHRWVVAQPGVRIGIKSKGFYRVPRTELQNAGFDVNVSGNLWQLYLEGREQSIIVGANDSYIEFYGEGMDTTESDTKYYYLIAGSQNGKRIQAQNLPRHRGSAVSEGFMQSYIKKERTFYVSSIFNGEGENYFSSVPIVGSSTTPTPANFTYNLKAINFEVAKASIEVSVQGLTINPHQVEVYINGNLIGVMSWQGGTLKRQIFSIESSLLLEGVNNLQFKALGGVNDVSLMDSARFKYSRKFESEQNQLNFYTTNYQITNVSGFSSSNIRVFDLSSPDTISQINNFQTESNGGTFNAVLPAHTGRLMFAVEASGVKSAASVSANTPSSLSTVNHNANMIIVTHKDWLTQANDWANYRIGQGIMVEVVNIEDIFDEYSYGSQSTSAMTNFFQYAKNNWQTPPNYILLIGDATFDFRNYENRPFLSFVPTKLVDTLYSETGSDEALCDFNNDGLAEIAVGRIPARSGAEVTTMLNKHIAFEAGVSTAIDRGALFISDLPIGYDFEGVNQRIAMQLPANMPRNFISRSDPNARNLILADLNTGRYLVNYSGHGSTLFWAASNFYHKNDFALMTNGMDRLTLLTALTCLNGYFVGSSIESFAETGIKTPGNGAVIIWASSGETTPDIQEIMATRFYNQLNVGTMTKMGDLVKDAKQAITGGRDVRLSWTLFGDPLTKVK